MPRKNKKKQPLEKPWFKSWPKGVPKHIKYPEIPLFDFLRLTAEKYPDYPALVYFGREITYKALAQSAERFATALSRLGVEKGDRIALFLPNIPQFVIAYYGAIRIGAVATAISPLYKEREVRQQLRDSEAEKIIVLDLLYPVVEKVWNETQLRAAIITNLKEYMPRAKAFLGTFLKKVPSRKVERKPNVHLFKKLVGKSWGKPPEVEINPEEDLASLQYTGGTTGTAKGAMLTHMNLVSNAVCCAAWLRGTEGSEIFLAALPLFHIYGMTTGMNAPIYIAGKVVLLPRFDLVSTLKAIERHKVTVFCGAPTMYSMLLNHPDIDRYNCTSIRFCISGSAPLPPEVQRKFMSLTEGVLVEGYGLTETSPVTHCNPLDKTLKTIKIGSIGLPWPDTESKIVDLKTGKRELKPGETGELIIAGPQVMKGYWKMPEETAQVLREGWLYTGDIGRMDEDGYFYIIDRKKDLIKYKGYSVYPRELEDVLLENPHVKLCGVIGKPDPLAGEIPKAFIVLKEGVVTSEEEVMSFVNEKVAPYKALREVEFRQKLPMTMVGKILKRELQKREKEKTSGK